MANLNSLVCGSFVWKANESPLAVLKPGTKIKYLRNECELERQVKLTALSNKGG